MRTQRTKKSGDVLAFILCALMGLIAGIAITMILCRTANAEERVYTRWFVVAYFDGIDKPYRYVATPFTNSTDCGDKIKAAQEENHIPNHVVVGCKMWTAKTENKP